jgi:hypothetical protein
MILKQYRRDSVLMLSAMAALSVIITKTINQALTIVDKFNSGEITSITYEQIATTNSYHILDFTS